jgi:hypothetical protein
VATAAAVVLLAAVPAAHATTVTVDSRISPANARPGTPLDLTVGMTLDPEHGQSSVIRRTVLLFGRGATANGRLFPSCSAETINTRRSFAGCPKGSLIGRGRARADVREVDAYNVPAVMTMFNGPGGRSVTLHVYAENPALISDAFTLPLTRIPGRYGYKLTIDVPYRLQEINEGWFVEIRKISVSVGATIRDRRTGRTRGYIEAGRCPSSGLLPVSSSFEFLRESPPTTILGNVACRP